MPCAQIPWAHCDAASIAPNAASTTVAFQPRPARHATGTSSSPITTAGARKRTL